MAGTNQVASDTWVPQTDKFGNQINPVWAQNGSGTSEQIAEYTTMIRNLANRALSTSGAGADAINFAGYTLPNNQYVQKALQGWTPPSTLNLDPVSGRVVGTTQLSYEDALSKLGITPGKTSVYSAPAPAGGLVSYVAPGNTSQPQSAQSSGGALYAPGSVMGTPQAPLGVVTSNEPTNNNRSLIAYKPGPGLIKGYDTNDGYKEVYVPAGKYVPGVSLYPKPTNTITPDSMKKETPINLPGATSVAGGAPVGASEATSLVAGANTSISEIIKQLTPVQTETEKKQQDLLDQMASLVGQQANKAADQLTAEQSAGLPQLRQEFAKINGEILTKSAEYDALAKAQEGKPITMNSIIGSERAILNAKASDIGLLTARAQALQGQIETAQNTANRSIDLKYSTIDAKLNVYQAQLNALQPTLNKEEKIAAQAQQILLDERKQALADRKNEEKQLSNYNIEMMSKYPSAGILPTDSYAKTNAKILKSAEYIADRNKESYGSGMVGEYQFYADQERKAGRTPMSFTAYQDEDANRKRLASTIANNAGLTPQQSSTLLTITNNYQKDALVQALDKGQGLKAIADQVIANPNSATNQLKSLYSFVKNLDPDSAVREGEIGLANQTTSFLDRFKTSLTRVAEGQVISPQAAKELAVATKELVAGWEAGVDARKMRYTAQAQQLGVGDAFNQYLQGSAGINSNNDPLGLGNFGGTPDDPLGLGFNPVGGDTNQASVGSLAQKYESGGDPGAIGFDSTGGWSYGIYQLAHNNAQRFVEQSPYAKEFSGVAFNSAAWKNKWKEVAQKDPQGFAKAQEDYIAKTHFEPLAVKAAQAGLDLSQRSPVLAEVIFSTGVQHGANTDVVNKALAKVGPDATDEELIKAIYQERWSNGQRFANSTNQVKQAVYNRFFGKNGELATALQQLKNYS